MTSDIQNNFGLENCESVVPLSTTEALQILQTQESRVMSETSRQSYQKTFISTFKYAELCSKIPMHKLDECKGFLQESGLKPDEIAMITSLLPQQANEAIYLVPSLERLGNGIEIIIEKFNLICNL